MSKYISEEKLVQHFNEIAEFQLPPETVRRDLSDIRKLLSDQEYTKSPAGTNVWRLIMKNKTTQYISAAMVFIAVFVAMQFLPESELSAAQLLTKVSKNMQQFKIVKSVTENFLPGQSEPTDYVTAITDYARKQVFMIYSEGYLHQLDYKNMIQSVYRPEDNTMIINSWQGEVGDPTAQVDAIVKKLSKKGFEVRQYEVMENDVELTIIEYDDLLNDISNNPNMYISSMRMGGKPVKTIKTKLFVNREKLCISYSERSYYDPQDNLIVTKKSTSEPVDSAPVDIYELGVPVDVKIINKVPDQRVRGIRKQIEEHKTRFLKNYIAVQTEIDLASDQPRLMEGTVIYCKGKKIRVDSFRSVYPSDKKKPISAEATELMKDSLALLEPYVPKTPRPRAIHLYDGLWQHIYEEQEGQEGDQMVLRKSHRRPEGDLYGDDDIEDFGWRLLWLLNEGEWIYEDDFSKDNNLLGMEVTWQTPLGWSNLPERKVLYVDPAKDYLYRRYIEEKLIDAPWQVDKSWLDAVEKKDRLNEQVRIYDVTEYGRTSEGQWYPKTITIKGYDCRPLSNYTNKQDFNRVSRIYLLEENPDLPDELFDPEQLLILKNEEE